MIELTKGRAVANAARPYIIAELGSNHNGDMEIAKRLILAAKEAGADCIKFQSWSKDTIFSKTKYQENYFIADDYRDRTDYTMEEIVDEYAISEQQLLEMKAYSDQVGITMTSTPFSEPEVDFLVDALDTPFIKIASMDLNNYPLLSYIAKKGRPIVFSTGMATLSEIDRAVRTMEEAGCKQLILLHCVAEYPTDDAMAHLRKMETFRIQYPAYPIGFSDHSLGSIIPIAAIALGAAVVEKHFTLDKEMEGWDHKVSATPDELATIVEAAKRIPVAMGSSRIDVVESIDRRTEFRRGAVVTQDLPEGHVLRPEDITFKRPARGIRPDELDYLIGRRLKKSLVADDLIYWGDLG